MPSIITHLDLDKYSKYKKVYFKIEGNLLLLILLLFYFLIKSIHFTVVIFIFSFIKVKFSYSCIHFFKTIEKLYNSLFIYSNVKLLKKIKITLLAQNTDKIKRNSISALYIFTFFKEVVTYYSSIHMFAISIVYLLL